MTEPDNTPVRYSRFTRILLGIFGFLAFLGFISEVYFLFYSDKPRYILTPLLGYISFIFLFTAYKGTSPSWMDDRDVFSITKNNKHPKKRP